jgi:hemerythrin superfamily protein
MDALQLLKNDHQTVEKLFTRFESAKKGKKAIADRIVKELAVHASIEEQLFYPAIRAAAKGEKVEEADEKVLEALEEHHVAKWLLAEIEKMGEDDERFEAKVSVLIESVRHHVKEEQGELFRFVRRLMGKDQLELLGNALAQAKKMAPTRPHPRAPDEPPGNLVAGAAAAVLDRGRDLVKSAATRALNGRGRGGRRAQPNRDVTT